MYCPYSTNPLSISLNIFTAAQSPSEVDGVELENRAVGNSYKGSLFTDRGPWSPGSAAALDKFHCFCTRHECNQIPGVCAGLGNRRDSAMADLNALIYKYTSTKVWEDKFGQLRSNYSDQIAVSKFLASLWDNKEKLCRAWTQHVFSFNHTTTQRGEGYNDRIKGHRDLITMLTNANLVKLHDHINTITLQTDQKAMDQLATIRQQGKRWSPLYETEVEQSMKLALQVTSVNKVAAEGGLVTYEVTDRDGAKSVVGLDTKIVHLGHVYIVPTCTCGYWRSSFRMCKCIVKVLASEQRDVLHVKNVHPYHLVQLHPLWNQALLKAKRADYSDFDHLSAESKLMNLRELYLYV